MTPKDLMQTIRFEWECLSRDDMLFMNRVSARWIEDGGKWFTFTAEEGERMRRLYTEEEKERIVGILAKVARFRDPRPEQLGIQ
ncbi:MAG: hypothetical protein KBC96_05525 [Armatimonadetes bacterium]|nr:hypothetical protein [Armatimonadota bacterium]